ncbi:hypothetical protein KJ359_001751 [Pestalotiopsis sp. 9143b]|nr:hypothetical protein KJ359_001751 [Pestalotiopsis sp. 9143b]
MDSSIDCESIGNNTDDEVVLTPCTTTATLTSLVDDVENTNQSLGSVEPTVVLVEMRKAADDIAQVVGRFGPKMAGTLRFPRNKSALFEDRDLLRLPCLKYADSFICWLTKLFGRTISFDEEAPLLWWL